MASRTTWSTGDVITQTLANNWEEATWDEATGHSHTGAANLSKRILYANLDVEKNRVGFGEIIHDPHGTPASLLPGTTDADLAVVSNRLVIQFALSNSSTEIGFAAPVLTSVTTYTNPIVTLYIKGKSGGTTDTGTLTGTFHLDTDGGVPGAGVGGDATAVFTAQATNIETKSIVFDAAFLEDSGGFITIARTDAGSTDTLDVYGMWYEIQDE